MAELDPQSHIRKQRNLAAGYALSNIIKSEPQVDDLIRLLESRFDHCIRTGQAVELDKWFNFFAFDAVGEVTFSQSFRFLETGTDVRNACANTEKLRVYVAAMGHYVWFHHWTLGNPLLSRLGLQPSSHIFDTCLDAFARRKKNPEVRKDMVAEWYRAHHQSPNRTTEKDIFAAAVSQKKNKKKDTPRLECRLFLHLWLTCRVVTGGQFGSGRRDHERDAASIFLLHATPAEPPRETQRRGRRGRRSGRAVRPGLSRRGGRAAFSTGLCQYKSRCGNLGNAAGAHCSLSCVDQRNVSLPCCGRWSTSASRPR